MSLVECLDNLKYYFVSNNALYQSNTVMFNMSRFVLSKLNFRKRRHVMDFGLTCGIVFVIFERMDLVLFEKLFTLHNFWTSNSTITTIKRNLNMVWVKTSMNVFENETKFKILIVGKVHAIDLALFEIVSFRFLENIIYFKLTLLRK